MYQVDVIFEQQKGNLSSFNDNINFQSMILENNALDNLRNISEDQYDEHHSFLNNPNKKEQNQLLNNLNNNSIMKHNFQNQSVQSFNIQIQQNSNEKTRHFEIAGWDNNNCEVERKTDGQNELKVKKLFNMRRSSTQSSQNEQPYQYTQQQSILPQTQMKLAKIKKYSSMNTIENKLDQEEQINSIQLKDQSFIFLSNEMNLQKQQSKIRSPSQINNNEIQREEINQDINQLKNIKLYQLSIEQKVKDQTSINQKNILQFENNTERSQQSLNSLSNRRLFKKKLLPNQNSIEQKQKVQVDIQQQSLRNLKISQPESIHIINSNSSSQQIQPSFLSNLILKFKQASLNQKISKHQNSTLEEINNSKKNTLQLPQDGYFKQKKIKPAYSQIYDQNLSTQAENVQYKIQSLSQINDSELKPEKYQHLKEMSQLKIEVDNIDSSITCETQNKLDNELKGSSKKYSNYMQRLYRNIQNRINCLEKQLDNLDEDDVVHNLSVQDGFDRESNILKPSNKQINQNQNIYKNQNQSQNFTLSRCQINQLSEFPNNFKIFHLNTYNNNNRIQANIPFQKNIESLLSGNQNISPNQIKPRKSEQSNKKNTYNEQIIPKLHSQNIILKEDRNIFTNSLNHKHHVRSSLQIQRKVEFQTIQLQDSRLQNSNLKTKTSDVSLNLTNQQHNKYVKIKGI